MKIVFMGTPDFAVESLSRLAESEHEILAVVTATDKVAGRGHQLQMSEVKRRAIELNLPILQPEKLRNPDFVSELKILNADVFVVVAFRMLPELVWSIPKYGTLNVHGSLLPNYRGAAPINHALFNGETETGVTTFLIEHEIDTGKILLSAKCPILPTDDFGTLYDKLKVLGADLLLKTLNGIADGTIKSLAQDESKATYLAPKITPEITIINPNKLNANEVHNRVRGLSPLPAARLIIDGKVLKIYKTKMVEAIPDNLEKINVPNFYRTKNRLFLECSNNTYLEIIELQPEGKKRLPAQDYLNGLRN